MILYRSGYRYQLHKTYRAQTELRPDSDIWYEWGSITREGLLEIKEHYAWDGPSGPAMDTRNAMRGSLIHDCLYQLLRLGKLPKSFRAAADREYQRACREDGMSAMRAWVHFTALRKFAAGAADPKSERQVLVAP